MADEVVQTDASAGTIALIEDEEAIRGMYSLRLKQDNFTVLEARNGKEGLDLVRKSKPSLVLLDIFMPEMSGFDVLKALKADRDPEVKNIPVVLLTNLAEDAGHAEAMKLGAVSYVMKVNRTPEQLSQLVKAILKDPGQPVVAE
jgi:CheY-like chemotaxis protein